jgi:hypothetical protein
MSLERFAKRMKKRADNVVREANRTKRLAALAVDQTLVMGTPVDTGRARSNWIVSLGEPSKEIIEPYDPTTKGGIGETANAKAALEQGKEAINKSRPEEAINITNNVEYIESLNEGHSAQAPAMFIEAAVEAGTQAVVNAKINTGK